MEQIKKLFALFWELDILSKLIIIGIIVLMGMNVYRFANWKVIVYNGAYITNITLEKMNNSSELLRRFGT
jgi:hypothetical protein